ncbi:MAG: polynucleotide adenylyltransferase PcnB [Deltaproteobacteria bacterium]|nr:polynucleotide adenylyltransferase PcnB [Deltaproteobacteria bacterium]
MKMIMRANLSREYPVVLARPHHSISRKSIDTNALKVLYRLHRKGFKAYLVGGAVRDLLLGKVPKDFDIVTDARPGQIKRLFANGYLIGRRFRLVHIKFKGDRVIEVSTFRKTPDPGMDSNIGTRRTNTYGTPRQDAFKRDITINALFYDISNFSIIDYVSGLKDISEGVIRSIGDPNERYIEDPVRIWRVLRHAARTNFVIEDNTARAIYTHRYRLILCSGARLFDEMTKDMVSGVSRVFCQLMGFYGVLPYIFGGIGTFFEQDAGAFKELLDLLGVIDNAILSGKILSYEIMLSVLFWPWIKTTLVHLDKEGIDKSELLYEELCKNKMTITIPKHYKANIVKTGMILKRMLKALDTSQMKWSLRKRARYLDAATICYMIIHKRVPDEKDPFKVIFDQRWAGRKSLDATQKIRHTRHR